MPILGKNILRLYKAGIFKVTTHLSIYTSPPSLPSLHHTLSPSLYISLTFSLSLALPLPHFLSPSLSHSHSLTLSLPHSLSPSLSPSHSHTLTLSLSPSLPTSTFFSIYRWSMVAVTYNGTNIKVVKRQGLILNLEIVFDEMQVYFAKCLSAENVRKWYTHVIFPHLFTFTVIWFNICTTGMLSPSLVRLISCTAFYKVFLVMIPYKYHMINEWN